MLLLLCYCCDGTFVTVTIAVVTVDTVVTVVTGAVYWNASVYRCVNVLCIGNAAFDLVIVFKGGEGGGDTFGQGHF